MEVTSPPLQAWLGALPLGAGLIAVGLLTQGPGILGVGLAEGILALTAAALLVQRLAEGSREPRGADHLGAGLLLLAAAALAGIAPLTGPGRLVLAQGALACFALALIALFRGRRALGALAVPILVLYLAVPLLPLFEATLSYPMRRFSALVTAAALEPLFGPITLQGTEIWIKDIKFSVTSACSGFELLQNLAWVAWWTVLSRQRGFWRRLAHGAIAIPAALIANTLRVMALALWALHDGEEVLLSSGHQAIAWAAVALAAGFFLWIEGRLPATAEGEGTAA